MKYTVIGAGASGMVCAINLARCGHEVLLLEKNSTCGKKILATGNGHCNYYNSDQNLCHYHSSNKQIIKNIINDKTNRLVLDFFDSIGIVPRIKNGYYYPYSNAAVSIQNSLYLECIKCGVHIINDIYINNIIKDNDGFIVESMDRTFTSDRVVIATGSSASIKDEVNTYELLENLGHNINPILPALSRINLDEDYMKDWSGIRCDASIKLLVNSELVREEVGEVLYTNNGISGIPTMQLSTYVAKALNNSDQVEIIINNMYKFCENRNDFIKFMDDRNKLLKNRNISELMDSIINYKLVNVLIKRAGLKNSYKWEKLDDRSKSILAREVVSMRLNVISTDSINKSQTISGGVPLTEINPKTMESLKVKGLYITGEAIDLYGDCGGYNLTIAWTTGLLVGGLND